MERWALDYKAQWLEELGKLPWMDQPDKAGWWASHYMSGSSPVVEIVLLVLPQEDSQYEENEFLMETGADAGGLTSEFASKWLPLQEFVRRTVFSGSTPTGRIK